MACAARRGFDKTGMCSGPAQSSTRRQCSYRPEREFDGSIAIWRPVSRASSPSPGGRHPRSTGHQATTRDAGSLVPHRVRQLARSPRNGDFASLLIAASALLFGVDAWIGFLVHTRPMIAAILEAPWRALPAQQNFASPLMAARSVGASMGVAYGIQTAVTLLCGAVAWWTWRTPDFERIPRVALTGLLALAAAPWVHTYDMIPLAVAIVVIAARMRLPSALLGFAWFWPGAVVLLPIPLPLSVASIAAVAWSVWREGRHSGSATWNIRATLGDREKGYRRFTKPRRRRQLMPPCRAKAR